jgi:hypothetical protein
MPVCAVVAHELCHPRDEASVALVSGVMLDREVNRRSSAEPFVPAPVLNVGRGLILMASA